MTQYDHGFFSEDFHLTEASQKAADVVGVKGTWKLQRLMDAVKAYSWWGF